MSDPKYLPRPGDRKSLAVAGPCGIMPGIGILST